MTRSKKSTNSKPTSFPGTIFFTDVDSFGGEHLTDVDRVKLRHHLQKYIQQVMESLEIDISEGFAQDTGDGILLIFPPKAIKTQLIESFIPSLIDHLREHNRTFADFMKLKVRAVLHFGEIIMDNPPITKRGVASNEIIISARLLDSELLRSSLRSSKDDNPLFLLISDDFYQKIIKHHLPIRIPSFNKCEVATKDRTLTAWAYKFTPLIRKPTPIEPPAELKFTGGYEYRRTTVEFIDQEGNCKITTKVKLVPPKELGRLENISFGIIGHDIRLFLDKSDIRLIGFDWDELFEINVVESRTNIPQDKRTFVDEYTKLKTAITFSREVSYNKPIELELTYGYVSGQFLWKSLLDESRDEWVRWTRFLWTGNCVNG